jgi:hypothetical protein
MKSSVRLHAFSETSCGMMLLAGLAACGSTAAEHVDAGATSEAGVASGPADAPAKPETGQWPAEVTVSTCNEHDSVNVGNYTVQTNYWNKSTCPGTQCLDINKSTGAFAVTQGPEPCGDNVASYPNVLYGCSFGNCSPGSILPLPLSSLSSVTSDWDYSVGGTADDRYNVSYDIWLCPDNSCGSNGFPGGTELMIWLDYKNVHGWKTKLGTAELAGHTWDVWQSTFGTAPNTWTYLAYMIVSPMVTSVTNLDLNAFFKDATMRGQIQDSWYLYAIHAGSELRTGGVPFTNNSFSVSINGVTPSTTAVVATGPACDGGMPTAEGKLGVKDNYVTAGPLHGYGSAWAWVGTDSKASICITPTCTAPGSLQVSAILGNGVSPHTVEPVTCAPAFAPSALCSSGTITGDPSYYQVAGVGFNLNQGGEASTSNDADLDFDGSADSGGDGTGDGGASRGLGTITIPKSITVSVSKAGTLAGNNSLRVQLTDAEGIYYCYGGNLVSGTPIPITQFSSTCWNNQGKYATSTTPIKRVDVYVPGATSDVPFSFCLTNVTVE